jgi:predicted MFS family arabinose efflux permease
MLAELRGGWRELRARPWAGLIILGACITLLVAIAPYDALGPAIGDEGYGEPAVFGLTAALTGAGSLAGSLLALRWWPRNVMFVAQLWVVPFAVMLFAFAAGAPVWLLVPLGLLAGMGVGLFMVWWETSLARSVPPAALSRVSAFDWMGSLGLLPLGFLLAGPIGAAVGVRETLLIGAGLAVVTDTLIAVAVRRSASSPAAAR